MNRSFRAEEKGTQAPLTQHRQLMGSLRSSVMKEKDEDLALFLEMRKREKERNYLLLLQNSEEFDASLGSQEGSSPIFDIASATPARKTGADDFLNSESDKNDYEWLLTPPGTPLFPSLEMDSPKPMMSQLGNLNTRTTTLKSRLANPQPEPAARSNLASRQTPSSPVLNNSSSGIRRPSSSGCSRPVTPTGCSTSSAASKSLSSAASKSLSSAASKSLSSAASKSISIASSKSISSTISKPSRSSSPTSRPNLPSTKPAVPPRSSTPTARSTERSSTPTDRPTVRYSDPAPKSAARSLTPTSRSSATALRAPSRAVTPTRKPIMPSSVTNTSVSSLKSPTSSSITNPVALTTRNLAPPRASSPTVKPRPWKPSEMPGFSLDVPPNLRTSLFDRPISATRGRPGAPTARSSSVEPVSNGRVRRQSCSPARGRPPNGSIHVGGSVPAINRAYAKANGNISPVVIGTKMVERVINMRKLAPPRQDDKHSPHSNISGKSSSPDSSGFGRTLSKKSLDMAIRHMDIRRRLPGSVRPSVTNIPASSIYSVRSGHSKSSTLGISDSPLAASSNGSSEVSVNNNAICVDRNVFDDGTSHDKSFHSPKIGGT